jgi:chromate transporter
VDGVTATAIGAIAGAVVILGKKSLIDLPTVFIAIIAVYLLWKYKKNTEPYIIIGCAIIGIILKDYIL